MPKTLVRAVVLASLTLAFQSAQATELTFPIRDAGARMERVGADVYSIIHDDATEEWPHGNTGVVVGNDAVLVIDAAYLPSCARSDIALIRTVTSKPVRYLVYTHWHFDHNNGASAYVDAFPNITVVSERATRDFIDINSTWWRAAPCALINQSVWRSPNSSSSLRAARAVKARCRPKIASA